LVGFPEAGLENPWPTALKVAAVAMAAMAVAAVVGRQVMLMLHW
jgi:hypothetical protein